MFLFFRATAKRFKKQEEAEISTEKGKKCLKTEVDECDAWRQFISH